MLLRILTAAVLIPVVVALVWWGPPMLLAAVAAGVALIALHEFFTLGERMGMHGFRNWTMLCAAGIFYAQYAAGMVETHSLGGGELLIRDAARGAVSVELVLLIFVFGAVGIGLATRRPLHDVLPSIGDQLGGNAVRGAAVQLSGARERNRSTRSAARRSWCSSRCA